MDLLKDRQSIIDERHDYLNQAEALKTLLVATREIKPPSCMALYGSWGSGKTALMRSAYEKIKNDDAHHHRAVWFDPWPYERSHDVLGMLVLSILDELGLKENHSLRKAAVRLLKPLSRIIGRVTSGLIKSAAEYYPGAAPVVDALGLDDMKPDEIWEVFEEKGEVEDNVKKIRAEFAAVVKEALKGYPEESRVVVFLDDLDRCMPDRAVWLLEATKLLLADSEGEASAVFVFGLDRQIVGEAVRARFPMSTLYTGENYLEKIFDLSLEAPPVRPDSAALRQFIDRVGGKVTLDKVTEAFPGQEEHLLAVLSDPAFANPRVIKRVINRLYLLTHGRDLPEVRLSPRKVFAWVAGAERFRTFRHFFVEASEEELVALDTAVPGSLGAEPTSMEPPARIRAFIDTPGFIRFYRELLDLGSRKAGDELRKQRMVSGTKAITTLQDLDSFMRSVGL